MGRQLECEEAAAARRTFLHTRRNGDGTTEILARVSDLVLLCGFRHHRAHDPHYDLRRRPGAGLTLHRRT